MKLILNTKNIKIKISNNIKLSLQNESSQISTGNFFLMNGSGDKFLMSGTDKFLINNGG